jgi:hypothetical protein
VEIVRESNGRIVGNLSNNRSTNVGVDHTAIENRVIIVARPENALADAYFLITRSIAIAIVVNVRVNMIAIALTRRATGILDRPLPVAESRGEGAPYTCVTGTRPRSRAVWAGCDWL